MLRLPEYSLPVGVLQHQIPEDNAIIDQKEF